MSLKVNTLIKGTTTIQQYIARCMGLCGVWSEEWRLDMECVLSGNYSSAQLIRFSVWVGFDSFRLEIQYRTFSFTLTYRHEVGRSLSVVIIWVDSVDARLRHFFIRLFSVNLSPFLFSLFFVFFCCFDVLFWTKQKIGCHYHDNDTHIKTASTFAIGMTIPFSNVTIC